MIPSQTTSLSVHSGIPSAGATVAVTCVTTQPSARYAPPIRNTLRRLSSANRDMPEVPNAKPPQCSLAPHPGVANGRLTRSEGFGGGF